MNKKDRIFYGFCLVLLLTYIILVAVGVSDRLDDMETKLNALEIKVDSVTEEPETEATTEINTDDLVEPSDDEIQISIGE